MAVADAPRTSQGYVTEHSAYGMALLDALENVPDLTWPSSISTYAKMRNDPQISAILSAYWYPLRSGTWVVNPKGCKDEVVELVADCWGLPILGDNDGPGPARRRGVDFDEHLRMALQHLVYGFMPFAERYEIRDGHAWLAELSERLPQTIAEIRTNLDGSLKEVIQTGETRPIPAKALTWYVREREGGAWHGRSMLRPAYGPWLIKHEMIRVMATSSRRFGAGTPVVEAPPGGTPAQVIEASRLASSIRVGEQGGIGLPSGFKATIAGMTGSVPDTLGLVRYLDQQIAQSVLASLLNLDASPNGSRALGDVLVGLLEMSWAATAKEITTPATATNVKIVDYSFGEDEPVPRIMATDINRPEATAEAVKLLMDCGAIKYDPALETAMRLRYKLPERDEKYVPPVPPPLAGVEDNPPEDLEGQPGKPAADEVPERVPA